MVLKVDQKKSVIRTDGCMFSAVAILMVTVLSATIIFFSQFSIDAKLLSLFVVWLYAVLFGIVRFERRFAYLVFILMIFVFIISRPVLAHIYGVNWKRWSPDILLTVISSIYVSIVAILITSKITENIKMGPVMKTTVVPNKNELKVLRIVFLIVIAITGLAYYYARIKFFLNFNDEGYADMYLEYTSDVPLIVNALSYFFPIAVACFLSMEPSRREVAIVLAVYVGSGVPLFLLGNRGSLILPIVFAAVYVLARDAIEKGQRQWVTKKMKIAFIAFTVAAMGLLGAMNYTRDGRQVLDDSQMPLLADFLYKQGTTFDTLAQGVEYKDEIEALPGDYIYSLNDVNEALSFGVIARYLDEKPPLPSGNSVETVQKRGSLAHRLSYVVMPESYLTGHGRGSSYIIETYLDWGLKGVIMVSVFIGLFLSNIVSLVSSRNMIVRTITINCLLLIFLMPRSETTRFISFIASPYYWILMLLIFAIRIAVKGGKDRLSQALAA